MNVKHFAISSFIDFKKVSVHERVINLRGFVSKTFLIYKRLKYVSVSQKLYLKNFKKIENGDIKVIIVKRNSDPSNLIERLIYERNMDISMKFKSIDIKNKEVFM